MTLNGKSQGQGHTERLQLRRSHQVLFPCKVSSLYWLMWPRTNLNAKVNQNYEVTLNRKSQGQGHRERLQLRRSHQVLFPCKVSSLYWLMWPRINLNAEVNQNVDRRTDRQTDGQTSSIHKPELLLQSGQKLWNEMKGLATRNTDAQYENPITSSLKVMSKVKVFQNYVKHPSHKVKNYGTVWKVLS